jgi:hypothetical protein
MLPIIISRDGERIDLPTQRAQLLAILQPGSEASWDLLSRLGYLALLQNQTHSRLIGNYPFASVSQIQSIAASIADLRSERIVFDLSVHGMRHQAIYPIGRALCLLAHCEIMLNRLPESDAQISDTSHPIEVESPECLPELG